MSFGVSLFTSLCCVSELVECGVGCYWKNLFAGCLCYSNGSVLLTPRPSALRMCCKLCASCYSLE